MSTQYMQPPMMHFGGPSQYYGGESSNPNNYASQPPVAPGTNGNSFAFRKRYERVDWRKIASLDIDNVSRTLDFKSLQENIINITFCNIEAELDTRFVDPNFVKLFKLAQLTIEYLLHSQEFLTLKLTALEDKLKTAHEDHEKTKKAVEDLNRELTEVKKESHKRKKLLIAQQQLIHAGSGSYNKCPYCTKAFLNSSFLTSHINRRHAEYFGSHMSPTTDQREVSPNRELEAELQEVKERLKMKEAQLKEEKRARRAEQRRSPDVDERTRLEVVRKEEEIPVVRVHGEEKTDKEKTTEMFMKEIKQMSEKLQASEQVIAEIKYGRRSNLGELQDDVDNEKELLQKQREEVALMRERLEDQLRKVEDMVSSKLNNQDKKWNKKVQKLNQQHAGDLKELSDALERTNMELAAAKRGKSQSNIERVKSEEVEELIKKSREQEIMLKSQESTIKDLIRPQSSATAAAEPDLRPKSVTKAETSVKMLSMEPSDEEDGTLGTGTGTGSFTGSRTPYSTLGTSGELTLQTTQFLDQLRKNPTLKIMRDQLAEVLEENLEKIGIARGTRGIPDEVLQSKLEHLNNRRQTLIQKYPVFPEFRKQFDQYAAQQAKEKLKALKKSPVTAPSRPPSVRPVSGSQQTMSTSGFGSSGHLTNPSAGSSPKRDVPSPQRRPSPAQPQTRTTQSSHPKPVPRSQSPKLRIASPGRAESPLRKTGSSAEYTSTQWDSDDDEEDSDDEPAFKKVPQVRPVVVSPARSVPSGQSINLNASASTMPRSQPQVKTIVSKPLKSKSADEDDDDDWDDSISDMEVGPGKPAINRSIRPTSAPLPKGQNVAQLSRSIELQLSGRKAGGKPVGGVDTMGPAADAKKKVPVGDILDFNSDSDWDVSPVEEEENKSAQRKGTPASRGSHASTSFSTNTYGSSQWGGSAKTASTVNPGGTRGTSNRSSFVSVTDVSDDEDLDLENI
ncbi:hypothetical protein CHS0354_014051 [Potamilus streckersoni]|uniref:C2H2-type domain-containing protein n=1 Tax=Potamilus streckersoni TaxID=2493646 RepID=A0AAE0VRC8_9BIVA|nr:hypothetical protein CHS0354_014051 [Potamilus streckersoni]